MLIAKITGEEPPHLFDQRRGSLLHFGVDVRLADLDLFRPENSKRQWVFERCFILPCKEGHQINPIEGNFGDVGASQFAQSGQDIGDNGADG